jgi:hypothetical protein
MATSHSKIAQRRCPATKSHEGNGKRGNPKKNGQSAPEKYFQVRHNRTKAVLKSAITHKKSLVPHR